MIISELKPIEEILNEIKPYKKIYIITCGICAYHCGAADEKAVEHLISKLTQNGYDIKGILKVDGICLRLKTKLALKRNLDFENIEAILVLSCGTGVQVIASLLEKHYVTIPVIPALNTIMSGEILKSNNYYERCSLCGDCKLALTGGICPHTMCAKGMLNGPCGGSSAGKCETDENRDCAWELIFEKLKKLGKLDNLKKIMSPKDYSKVVKPRYKLDNRKTKNTE